MQQTSTYHSHIGCMTVHKYGMCMCWGVLTGKKGHNAAGSLGDVVRVGYASTHASVILSASCPSQQALCVVLEFEYKVLCIIDRCSIAWATPPAKQIFRCLPFCGWSTGWYLNLYNVFCTLKQIRVHKISSCTTQLISLSWYILQTQI
jgi:hypothetical protein